MKAPSQEKVAGSGNAASAYACDMHPLGQRVLGDIWKHTVEDGQRKPALPGLLLVELGTNVTSPGGSYIS